MAVITFAGQNNFLDVGISLIDEAKQLDAIQQRHANVQHDQVNQLLLQDGQCLVRGGGGMDFPGFILPGTKQVGDHFEEGHAVIHKEHAILFRGAARGFRFFCRGRRGCGGHRPRGRCGDFETQFHIAQAQGLPGLQDGLGDGLVFDERAVG